MRQQAKQHILSWVMESMGHLKSAHVIVAALFLFLANQAYAELLIIPAKEMTGIEKWKENTSYGAGQYYSSDGTPLSKMIEFEGGEYEAYARIFTSPRTDAELQIHLNGKRLAIPMQAKVAKLSWIRLGSVEIPKGNAELRVESPTPGVASGHNMESIAFCSTPLDDRVGRVLDWSDWLRQELTRLEGPKPAPRTAAEARERQQVLRSKVLDALGLDPLPQRTPLNARVTGRIEKDDYTIEKIAFESRPNHVVPALLYLPKNASGPFPAVVSAIGHWSYGKSSKAPQRRGIGLAKRGYAVLALDPAYAWERGIPGNSEGFEPLVAGGCIAGHMAWDIMRAADYLETRPDIDATRLSVTGVSGGGTQTFYAGIADERFKAVMPSVSLWSMPEIAIDFFYSIDNWVPGISQMGGMGNLIALTAPRAMLVMNVDGDYTTSYVQEQMVNAARPYYRLLGANDKLLQIIDKGSHDYTQLMREATYSFVDRWIKGVGDGFLVPEVGVEQDLFDEKDPALFVFEGGKIPTEGAETVTTIWAAEAAARRAELSINPQGLAGRMRNDVLHMPPLDVTDVVEMDRGFLVTTEPGVQVAVYRVGEGQRAVIWVGEKDLQSESNREEVQALAQDATVFVLEPSGIAMPEDLHILKHAPIVMGRPVAGMWAYDVLCVVDYLAQKGFQHISVAGQGRETGLTCLLATLLDERIEFAAIDSMFSSFVQLVGYGNPACQIPGILKVADVEHLVKAAGTNRVQLNNLESSKWAGTLESSKKSAAAFFEEWEKMQPSK